MHTHWDCKPGKGERAKALRQIVDPFNSLEYCQKQCVALLGIGCVAIDYTAEGSLINPCRLYGSNTNVLPAGSRRGSKYCEMESETKIKGNAFLKGDSI